jgi:signal transduction histidine kinase
VLFDFTGWMFVNLMVAIGVAFLAGPPIARGLPLHSRYPWRPVAAASIMAIFCMLFPWVIAPDQILDLRMAPMTLVGLAEGWDKAIPVGLVIIAYRVATAGPLAAGTLRAALWTPLAIAVLPWFDRRPRTVWRLTGVGLVHAFIGWSLSFLPFLSEPLGPFSPYWPVFIGVILVSLLLLNAAVDHVQEKQILQEQLQEELRLKEAVLGLLPYGILFIDAQRRLMDCNEAARSLLAGGQLPPQWLAHPEVEQALQAHRRISACRIAYPEGTCTERIVLLSAVPLPSGGAVLGIQNVTGVVAEEREEARRHRLELLGRLAATAAHEIKNPLTTIKGFLQLLAPHPEFDPYRQVFGLVQGEVEQINRVVTDFLGLAARPALAVQRLSLDDLLHEVLAVLAVQFPQSAVEVQVEGTPDLEVDMDRTALKQILQNLATNAFEAMPSGGRLVLRRERTDTGIRITVSDTGPGIAPDVLPLIFTPYMTTKATGTGLGLAISHKLALEMGSRLDVTSEPGKGSAFTLDLPRAAPGK